MYFLCYKIELLAGLSLKLNNDILIYSYLKFKINAICIKTICIKNSLNAVDILNHTKFCGFMPKTSTFNIFSKLCVKLYLSFKFIFKQILNN